MKLMLTDERRENETPALAAVRRLRGEMAQYGISASELARRVDRSQQAMQRRMSGELPLDLDLLARICEATGISYGYVTTGVKAVRDVEDGDVPAPAGIRFIRQPDGYGDTEPLTFGLKVRSSTN